MSRSRRAKPSAGPSGGAATLSRRGFTGSASNVLLRSCDRHKPGADRGDEEEDEDAEATDMASPRQQSITGRFRPSMMLLFLGGACREASMSGLRSCLGLPGLMLTRPFLPSSPACRSSCQHRPARLANTAPY